MVATRRGVRLSYPNKTNEDASSAVQATPSTGRRTRSTKAAESSAQEASVEETGSQPETEPGPAASSPIRVRCTRALRLHSPEEPCSHAGSVHEADLSDVDSCCSGMSEPAVTRARGRRKPASSKTMGEDDEVSEVESCSSVVSASKADLSIRRSTRRKKSSDPALDREDDEAVVVIETESSSSTVSQSQRKSQRKSTRMRLLAKQQTEDAELSDAASCTSSVSEVEAPVSAVRRSTRPRRQTQAVPYLDQVSAGSRSPAPAGRKTRAARGEAAAAAASEAQSCDSEGFESGPSMTPRRRTRALDSDSDLNDTPMGSPCSARGRGTPCSSRTGSGNSSRASALSRLSTRRLRVVLEKTISGAQQVETGETGEAGTQAGGVAEPAEEGAALNDSRLESTVMADPECTLLDEEETVILVESDEDGSAVDGGVTEVGYRGIVSVSSPADVEMCEATTAKPSESAPLPSASGAPHEEEAISEAVVSASDQQEEPSAENKGMSTSEMELNQEIQPPSEPSELPSPQLPKETVCEQAVTPEVTEEEEQKEKEEEEKEEEEEQKEEEGEGMEVFEVNNQPSVETEPPALPQEEGEGIEVIEVDDQTSAEDEPLGVDVVKMPLGGEKEMEVSASDGDAQQVVESSETAASLSEAQEAPVETFQVTNQEKRVTVEPETQPEDTAVSRGRGMISLLESSEDEEEDDDAEEEEQESSGEEEEEQTEEERAKPQEKNEEAGMSVDGLFMIDTRPGQDADQQYYKDGAERDAKGEEEEQDEDFVDEKGDDGEDDDTRLLFYSRNSQLKELSSRIDPGIRVKELGGLYINFDGSKSKSVSRQLKEKKIQDEVMRKSVVSPDFEKKDAVPPYSESKQALKMKRREERGKSTGSGWFDMKAPELTQELKGDLHVLKMRSALDSKRFYKKNDRDGFPKYFQVGTVVDNPADFYHSRVPKKNRKRTMVEELLADAEFRQANKKKFQHIVSEKAAHGAGRRNKKKSRFHKK